jgi:two-component system, NarL family, sensor kinase
MSSHDGRTPIRHYGGVTALVEPAAAVTLRRPERRRLTPVAALLAVAFLGVVSIAGLVVDPERMLERLVSGLVLFAFVAALSFGALGWLLARHQPANRLASLAAAMAWGFAIATVLDRYATLGHARGWPGTTWALWGAQWTFVPAMWAIPTLLVLRFPNGRLPSVGWRRVELLAVAGIVAGTTGWAMSPYGTVDASPALPLENPLATDFGVAVFWPGQVMWTLAAFLSLVGFVLRVRRARGVERAQLRWVLLGTGATILTVALGAATSQELVSCLGIGILPASIAIAVLRHGLWDVDVVLHRSIVYGLLTAAILLVYAGTVATLGGALGRSFGAPLVATVAVAVGVQPLRDRLQRLVSHLLYGEREEPYAALARLGEQLDAVVDRSGLLVGVTDTVVRAMRLRGAAIVVDDGVVAQVGEVDDSALAVPLAVRGEPVGTLLVDVAEGDELRSSDRRLLTDIARQVSAAVEAERLHGELEASRARLVSAREEERRRIRRDLHDELGPTLAAIAIEIERAVLELETDPQVASARLDAVAGRVRGTVQSVRALVEGLRPPALDDLGLADAVRELVRSLGRGSVEFAVTTDDDLGSLPAAVELAAYRILGEALTNVVRHAGSRSCQVSLRRTGDSLVVLVDDDGRGPGDRPAGLGRRSMVERAVELGGTLEFVEREAGGTRVRAVLPLEAS